MATYKAILVHLRSDQEWGPSVEAAIGIAHRFGSDLTGLYTNRDLAILKLVLGREHDTVRTAEERSDAQMQSRRMRFEEACDLSGVACTFDEGEGNAAELLSLAGRCQDLVVIGQSARGLDGLGTDVAEECAVACGTPTIIVPRSGSFAETGKCVAVGWNHSRQAAAALRGALPFISRAERVVILMGGEREAMSSVMKRPRTNIEGFVRRFRSNVEVRPFTAEATGANLQAAAREAGADLLVMGAYGRPAWRELVFGGTTRDVVAKLELPVLMAH